MVGFWLMYMGREAANRMAFVMMYICGQFVCWYASFMRSPMVPHVIIVIALSISQFMASRFEDTQYIGF